MGGMEDAEGRGESDGCAGAVVGGPAPPPFVELPGAFAPEELQRALGLLRSHFEGDGQSFTSLGPLGGGLLAAEAAAELSWLTDRMLGLAVEADSMAGWGLATGPLEPTDELVYDRFGPSFSDKRFDWHCDDNQAGPRAISVVAYFTDPGTYEGGDLQLKVGGAGAEPAAAGPAGEADGGVLTRRYPPGAAVAFPSKVLEHRVTPVTRGERRSLLLLCAPRRSGTTWSFPRPAAGEEAAQQL